MREGWLKYHYSLIDWEYANVPNMMSIWSHLLLRAERKTTKHKGVAVRRGQVMASVSEMCSWTGMSIQEVRTCLERLKSAKQITTKATSRATIVTICKFADYQVLDQAEQQAGQQAEQQASNKRKASIPISSSSKSKHNNKNPRNKKETLLRSVKKESSQGSLSTHTNDEKYLRFQDWIERNAPRVAKMSEPFTPEQVEKIQQEFSGEQMREILTQMHNFKPLLTKYVSAYETCRNWLKREQQRQSEKPARTSARKTESVNEQWGR